MNSGMVHFIASDAHDCTDRPPDLSAAYKLVQNRWGEEQADAVFVQNPSAVIWDQPIFAPMPKPVKKSSFFSFWK
jgi:protein-tyrosine phosphatase